MGVLVPLRGKINYPHNRYQQPQLNPQSVLWGIQHKLNPQWHILEVKPKKLTKVTTVGDWTNPSPHNRGTLHKCTTKQNIIHIK